MHITKHRSIEYTKRDGNQFIVHYFYGDDCVCKKVGPAQWEKSKLPDTTTDYTFKLMLPLAVKKLSNFGRQIDWNGIHRKLPVVLSNKSKYKRFQLFQLSGK